jgi:hypothetical protein
MPHPPENIPGSPLTHDKYSRRKLRYISQITEANVSFYVHAFLRNTSPAKRANNRPMSMSHACLIDFQYETKTTQLFTPTDRLNCHRRNNTPLSNLARNAHAANHNLYTTTTSAYSATEVGPTLSSTATSSATSGRHEKLAVMLHVAAPQRTIVMLITDMSTDWAAQLTGRETSLCRAWLLQTQSRRNVGSSNLNETGNGYGEPC